MTAPSQPQPLRVYRVFGLLLVTALVLTSAGYVFFRVTPQERNVNVAGIIIPVPDGMKKVVRDERCCQRSRSDSWKSRL